MNAPKEIRKAATVLLVRGATRGVEVFMMKRPSGGDFPDLHVFPGGKVDAQDDELGNACVGLDDRGAAERIGLPRGGLRYWVAAIRECFEEAGVLLAYRDRALFSVADAAEARRFDAYREALIAGDLTMDAFARGENLTLATDRVHYFSHWITPEMAPARFDVRFFVAAMPQGQAAAGHARETVSGEWVSPAQALGHKTAGTWMMIEPTLRSLEIIDGYSGVEALCASVDARRHLPEITAALHRQGMQHDS